MTRAYVCMKISEYPPPPPWQINLLSETEHAETEF